MNIEYFIKNWESIDKKDINFSEEQWEEISIYKYLSEEFIKEFKDKVDWGYISSQKLSEEFIREFIDIIYWDGISFYQELSEEFIREFQNEVNWYNISYCQKLSGRFIDEFIDYIYYRNSFKNTYQERFYQHTNSYLYTINKRVLCCLGYQWHQWNSSKFIRLFNSTLPIIFSEVL